MSNPNPLTLGRVHVRLAGWVIYCHPQIGQPHGRQVPKVVFFSEVGGGCVCWGIRRREAALGPAVGSRAFRVFSLNETSRSSAKETSYSLVL